MCTFDASFQDTSDAKSFNPSMNNALDDEWHALCNSRCNISDLKTDDASDFGENDSIDAFTPVTYERSHYTQHKALS